MVGVEMIMRLKWEGGGRGLDGPIGVLGFEGNPLAFSCHE